jgi:hypothetical protein
MHSTLQQNHTPRILSIDVGVKNLALCMFEPCPEFDKILNPSALTILYWNVLDVSGEVVHKCCADGCTTVPKFAKCGQYFCLRHAKKKKDGVLPTKETSRAAINKLTVGELHNIAMRHGIAIPSDMCKKIELKHHIIDYFCENRFEEVDDSINGSTVHLHTVGRNLKTILNTELDCSKITHVAIENQIGPMAIRMKAIQATIAQYFIMKNDDIVLFSVASTRKLEECKLDKSQYPFRKKLAIKICKERLESNIDVIGSDSKWTTHFNAHNKKDDLADAFLQGTWVIKHLM